jgi:hypothetical protein
VYAVRRRGDGRFCPVSPCRARSMCWWPRPATQLRFRTPSQENQDGDFFGMSQQPARHDRWKNATPPERLKRSGRWTIDPCDCKQQAAQTMAATTHSDGWGHIDPPHSISINPGPLLTPSMLRAPHSTTIEHAACGGMCIPTCLFCLLCCDVAAPETTPLPGVSQQPPRDSCRSCSRVPCACPAAVSGVHVSLPTVERRYAL